MGRDVARASTQRVLGGLTHLRRVRVGEPRGECVSVEVEHDVGEALGAHEVEARRDGAAVGVGDAATTANLFVEQSACTRTAPTVNSRRSGPCVESAVRTGKAVGLLIPCRNSTAPCAWDGGFEYDHKPAAMDTLSRTYAMIDCSPSSPTI